ncbi:MAG: biotin/lipoyl-binding protein [bacterium]|nr:biotin/lipoyl-binding protein [bacterium]
MHLEFRTPQGRREVTVRESGGVWRVSLDGRELDVAAVSVRDGIVGFALDGVQRRAHVAVRGAERHVAVDGRVLVLRLADEDRDDQAEEAADTGPHLRAQLPGKVVKLLVAAGDVVTAGQPLVILEAMKMETEVAAPRGGRVARVHVEAGRILAMGDPLLDLEPDQEPVEGE